MKTQYDRGWHHLTDEELARWLAMYRTRRANFATELDPACMAESLAFLDTLIADGGAEQARRRQAGLVPPPPRFDPAFVADLKSRIALDELCAYELGARLGKLVGGKRQGPCPICRGGTNCFTVYLSNTEDQHYHCFRCGAGGDAISIIMQAYHDTFPEAVERLCRFGHVDVPDPRAGEKAALAALPGRVAE